MPTLFVTCHGCGKEYPSGIAHDETLVGKVQMFGVLMRCPTCKHESRYDTHEFHFPAGTGAPGTGPR
jgi:hypothetical protein